MIFVDDGYEQGLPATEKGVFEKYLSLEQRHVLPPDLGGDDAEIEKQFRANIKLYQCSDYSGKYRVTEIKTGPLKQTDLDSDASSPAKSPFRLQSSCCFVFRTFSYWITD